MKLALLADIHGNYVALKECLNYIDNQRFDGVIFLGDYITDCPYPQKTMELIKQTMAKNKTWAIRGNREDYMLSHRNNPDEWVYSSQTGNFLYTFENLTTDDFLMFENMPIANTINIENCKSFTICHGSPDSTKEMLKGNENNSHEWLDKINTDYLFCGHTHKPFHYKFNGKHLVNVGSVGMPTNSQTDAQFTVIEFVNKQWKIELVSLPYNIKKLLQEFETSGIYKKYLWWAKLLAKALQTGVNYPVKGIIRAFEIAGSKGETLAEEHWQQAYEEMGID